MNTNPQELEELASSYADQYDPNATGKQMMDIYKAYIAGAQWQQSQPGIKQWVSEWIDVKDRLPEIGERVLVIDDDGDRFIDIRMGNAFGKDTDERWSVYTHWQPLPLPPNSTTTPKSDMVSKADVIKLIQDLRDKYKQDQTPLSERVIQECITKIKQLK